MRQKAKFQQLVDNKDSSTPTSDKAKIVINLSKRTLTMNEEEVLLLGHNFALSPRTMRLLPSSLAQSSKPVLVRHWHLPNCLDPTFLIDSEQHYMIYARMIPSWFYLRTRAMQRLC